VVRLDLVDRLYQVIPVDQLENQDPMGLQVVKAAKVPMANPDSLVDVAHAVNKVKMVKRVEKVYQVLLVYVDHPVLPVQTQMFQWIR
jgi:hypothetical protein